MSYYETIITCATIITNFAFLSVCDKTIQNFAQLCSKRTVKKNQEKVTLKKIPKKIIEKILKTIESFLAFLKILKKIRKDAGKIRWMILGCLESSKIKS